MDGPEVPPTPRGSAWDRVLLVLATGLGSGYAPVAPGTAGSLVGLVLAVPLLALPLWAYLAVTAAVCAVGVPASDRAERHFATKDARPIVIDEVAGMLVTVAGATTSLELIAGFFLFRLLDIFKPFPCRWAERNLPGGLGVMADDVMAGVYGCALLHLGRLLLSAGA